MVFVTRRERFNAAHKLWRPEWSDEKNEEVFGKCSNKNWHGHNYELFVTIKGQPDENTGFVMDLKDLSREIKERIIDKLDHRNINLDVAFMKGEMASTEILAMKIWDELEEPIRSYGAALHSIKLVETENNFVEYYGK